MKKALLKQEEGYAPSLLNPSTGKPMFCPLDSDSSNPSACGGWCAWFDIQAKNMGGDPPFHVTCKGEPIAEIAIAPTEQGDPPAPKREGFNARMRVERVIRALGMMGVRHCDTDAGSLREIADAVLQAVDDEGYPMVCGQRHQASASAASDACRGNVGAV